MTTSPLRLCHLRKRPNFHGYGFTLHADTQQDGHCLGEVDPDTPADAAGLKVGDRIIEVNGVNVLGEKHAQVVERIKALESETKFLVADRETFNAYQEGGMVMDASAPTLLELFSEPQEHLARLCHLNFWQGFDGFGFNLHYNKEQKKHAIGNVDECSPARMTGMVEGDVIVEVNGDNVEQSCHKDVVEKITNKTESVSLLLVSCLDEEYFKQNGIVVEGSMAQLKHLKCPPHSTNAAVKDQPQGALQQPPQQSGPPLYAEENKREEEEIKPIENFVSSHRLRLSQLRVWADGGGYGFNMQSEKKKAGQFISSVDKSSPADLGGMKEGDLILAVNGTSVKDLKHQDVVGMIREIPNEATLLLVDPISKEHFEKQDLPMYDAMIMEEYVDRFFVPESKPSDNSAPLNGSVEKVANKENVKTEQKQEILLDVNNIQPSDIYTATKSLQAMAGSGGVILNTKHVPSPAGVIGDAEWAGSAQEARQRLAKKKQASHQMSLQARYELYKKL